MGTIKVRRYKETDVRVGSHPMTTPDPLAALKPLHDPAPISWWPPAPGWWLVLLLVTIVAFLVYRLWKKGAPQRAALYELKMLESRQQTSAIKAAELNKLLKRYALVALPGTGAESLSGESWLDYLDQNGGTGEFSNGIGRALLTLPYGEKSAFPDELMGLARKWIKANRPKRGKH